MGRKGSLEKKTKYPEGRNLFNVSNKNNGL